MLTPDTRLGHYKVLEPIGAGGMGEVYRARDERLNRDVAIKVLPEAFARDADRLARFQREAQLLASLNHPNIGSIYGLEEDDGISCLVLELIEGPTLAERIARGPLPLQEALKISRQMAEALEAAHDRGIIHRDLKPGNVKVTPEGMVKVLDFGLAKALEGEPAAVDVSKSPTLGAPASQVGILLGTAGYMSPEQAKGKPVDRRADIWAFGVVLVEMLTGKPLFEGETVSETLAAVMMREPDLSALPGDTPPPIRRLLTRCLQKDPRQRLQAIGEARIVMEDLLAGKVEEAVVPGAAAVIAQPAWRRLLPWGLLVVVAVGAATAVAFWSPWQSEPVQQPMRLRVEISPENPLYVDLGAAAALSPDGTKLAYVAGSGANRMLYLRTLEQYEGAPLSGTEGARSPFFSPDGQWIGFFTNNKLKKVSVAGGAPLTLCDTQQNRGGTWGPDDTIVFAPDITTGLSRVPASGGTPEPITERQQGERSHRWPSFLPDGQHVLFIGQRGGQDYDDASIEVLNLETGERKVVHEGGTYPRYLPTGHLAYIRDGTLFAAPFDLDRLEVTGTPAPVLQEVLSTPGGTSGTGAAQYAFSQNGLLVYLTGTPAVQKFPIVWVDRRGNVTPMVEDQRNYSMPRLSPDGTRLALVIEEESSTDIWVYDIERGAMTRLTFG
ncbi:MAG: protein kinase, partial [Candidatus Acidoferrales bacterium]